MRIVYDHQIFSMQEYGGISRYYYELAMRMTQYDGHLVRILCPLYVNKYLIKIDPTILAGRYVPHIPLTSYSSRLFQYGVEARKCFNASIVKRMLSKACPDIVHETFYSKDKLSSSKVKTVITVYDMIHEKFRSNYSHNDRTSNLKATAINRADSVICISESTRKDLIEMLSIAPSKTSVVHLGYSLTSNMTTCKRRIISKPYLLFVGGRFGYKNFNRLLHAYATSPKLSIDFNLVCMGGGNIGRSERQELERLGINKKKIRFMSGPDEVLANLYNYASAFVFPSLYEGFGIPALEAMDHRCPIVCSNTAALSEVVGDAAEFFDPYDIDCIRTAIENVVYSSQRSKELIDLGLKRLGLFSWDKCAQETHQIYLSLN